MPVPNEQKIFITIFISKETQSSHHHNVCFDLFNLEMKSEKRLLNFVIVFASHSYSIKWNFAAFSPPCDSVSSQMLDIKEEMSICSECGS